MADRTCPTCGVPVTGHGNRKYCSRQCARSALYERQKREGETGHFWRRTSTVRPSACLRCEERFDEVGTRKPRLYCTDCTSYGAKSAAERKKLWRRNWAQKSGNVVVDRTIPCVTCGAAFTTSQPRAEACSRYCNQRSPKAQARKAARRGADVAGHPFTTEEIADRDGWRCGICDKRIPASAKWPDPRSLSLDHVIPVSEGGDHVRANVQAAHFRCNLSKGARAVGEQLRLIG